MQLGCNEKALNRAPAASQQNEPHPKATGHSSASAATQVGRFPTQRRARTRLKTSSSSLAEGEREHWPSFGAPRLVSAAEPPQPRPNDQPAARSSLDSRLSGSNSGWPEHRAAADTKLTFGLHDGHKSISSTASYSTVLHLCVPTISVTNDHLTPPRRDLHSPEWSHSASAIGAASDTVEA